MWLDDFVSERIDGSGGDVGRIAVVGAKSIDKIGLVLLLEDGRGTRNVVSALESGTENV